MLLAVDSGNTNVVFAVFDDDGAIRGEWRAATNANRTSDEFGAWLERLLDRDGIDKDAIDAAVIATVVPDNLIHLQMLARDYFGCEPLVVNASVELGIKVLIDHPEEAGADRLCNAVAANASYDGPLLIIDFGTATTFDVVDGEGNYRGGVIYPGINLSLEALHMGAAQLPRVALKKPEKIIGTGTVGAMQSGIFWGHVSMIDGLTARIAEEFGAPMTVIATGGHAELFHHACESIDYHDADLTLRGLLAIHQLNPR